MSSTMNVTLHENDHNDGTAESEQTAHPYAGPQPEKRRNAARVVTVMGAVTFGRMPLCFRSSRTSMVENTVVFCTTSNTEGRPTRFTRLVYHCRDNRHVVPCDGDQT